MRTVGSRSGHVKYPLSLRKKLNQKAAAWRVYKRFRTGASLLKHKTLAQECRRSIYSYMAKYESRLVDSVILVVSFAMQIINLALKLLLALY